MGGAQQVFKITPDLTTLGKVIGGGMPVGAIGGKADIMSHLAPQGPVYQAGTLSGNPLAMAAGLATLEEIAKPGFYEKLSLTTSQLVKGLQDITTDLGIPFFAASLGGMFGFCFNGKQSIDNYTDVAASNEALFKRFFHGMLQKGIYFAPSMYEAGFVSSAHAEEELRLTHLAAETVLAECMKTTV
ncbi:glutamate-1-semialdehyde aminotransferase [Legionella taurinensis]|nr:glutamate-1-semialdehyde aminotransferase [Legionella taurinensis]TID32748.1 glutamate-1-semialdehyde aminotransferase [Legionella taurinensis]